MRSRSGPGSRLATSTKLVYAGPTLWLAAMSVPVFVYMSKFYADVVLVPLGYLALAIALARAFDAITDPLMGWLSDRTRTRWGRRRPYLVLGAPLLALAFIGLFAPPAALGVSGATLWFGAFFLAYFLCYTIFSIPYNALGAELSMDYHERSSLFGYRESLAICGTILAAVSPWLLGWLDDDRRIYATLGMVLGLGLVVFGFLAGSRLRERTEFATRESNPFVPGVRRALRNRPFRILLASYVVGSVTAAIPGTLLPFYIQYVIRPDDVDFWTTAGITAHFVAALAAIPVFVFASQRVGKRAVWLGAYLMSIFSLGAAFFLREGDIGLGIVVFAWAGVAFGGQLLLTPSIQADVIDYDELHTGKRREAQYGALWALFPKLIAIPGAAIPLAVLGAIGYEPNVQQSPDVVFAIRALLGLVPSAFAALALLIAWRFPITESLHRRIQQGIEQHARGEPALDPLTGHLLHPPGLREVSEDASWLLDHFSAGELRRAERGGVSKLISGSLVAAGLSLAMLVATIGVALLELDGFRAEPGALAVLAITGAGISLSLFVFHAIRFKTARGIDPGKLSPELLRAHGAALSGRGGGVGDGAVVRS